MREDEDAVEVLEGLIRGPPILPLRPLMACRYCKRKKRQINFNEKGEEEVY